MKTLVFQVIDLGTVRGQCVLDNDCLQARMFPFKIIHHALCCIAFAVVFSRTVVFQNGLGGQRRNLALLGVDHRYRDHQMVVVLRPDAVVLDATFLALDLVRTVVACAVESDQVILPEYGPVLKNFSALQGGLNFSNPSWHCWGLPSENRKKKGSDFSFSVQYLDLNHSLPLGTTRTPQLRS